jgi:hypothetical protein
MLCSMTMPVEAGTPQASPKNPLVGVMIMPDPRVMGEIALEIEAATGVIRNVGGTSPQALARWDGGFTEALSKLLEVLDNPIDAAVLGPRRLSELHYAVLKGEAGGMAKGPSALETRSRA